MLEIKAGLPTRSVFLAGETIECNITFKNVPRTKRDERRMTKLAWASAQVHCQCTVSESRVDLPKAPLLTSSEVTTTGSDTSFIPSKGEKGSTALSTKPVILFCDLHLKPKESKTYTYRETIPLDALPSYRGTAVKYSYKITIGTGKIDSPTSLLKVPFTVLIVPGLNDISVYNESPELKPSNPFQRCLQPENNLLDIALEVLQTITCRKGTNFYNITNARGKVARFCLFKHAYRVGDDIVGVCDFSEAIVPCVQFSVTLQSEEVISEDCCKKSSPSTTLTSYSKHHEFTLHTSKTHISIPVPLNVTPGFNTDIVCLKWRLHFEFLTSKAPLTPVTLPDNPEESSTWRADSELQVETMIWDLPIKVFATNPHQADTVSMLKTERTLKIFE